MDRLAAGLRGIALGGAVLGLLRLLIRILENGSLDLGLAGVVIREEEPVSYWAVVIAIVMTITLLLLLAVSVLTFGLNSLRGIT